MCFYWYGFYLQWGIFTQLQQKGKGLTMQGRMAYALVEWQQCQLLQRAQALRPYDTIVFTPVLI